MRITEVKAIVVELPARARRLEIVQVPDPFRLRYTHRDVGSDRAETETYLVVRTDEGIEGICTGAPAPAVMEVLRTQVLGTDPLRREETYQRLHHGTRWVYQTPGWFGNFDNCLWDIAGKVAGLPVCRLLGQVRDCIPAYLTGGDGDGTAPTYLALLDDARARWGINAYKFHNYQGPRQNIALFNELRRALGDDFVLMNDPVCSYSLEEAIPVGHVMEALGFLWLEEPFYEQVYRWFPERTFENVLIVTDGVDENLMLSSRNLPNVNVCAVSHADPVSLIRHANVLLTKGAMAKFEELLK